jgi:glycosyltransferase involved in cell wall biosynthesis
MAGNTFFRTKQRSSGSGPVTRREAPTTSEEIDTQGSVAIVPMASAARISIIIPAMNEERNLPHVLPRLPADCEIILVDGHSTDETVLVAQRLRPDIVVIGQTRIGKGNALACGFAAATGDYIVMIDADGSNDPAEIPRFVAALEGGADFAKGSRFLAGGGSHDISALRRVGNFWLNKIVNVLYGTRYTDLCYGYNAFRQSCLESMRLLPPEVEGSNPADMLWGDGFEIETLINLRIAKAGLSVTEVPSFEAVRHFGASNLNALSDGLRVLRTIHDERRRSQRNHPSATTWPKQKPGLSVVIEEAS